MNKQISPSIMCVSWFELKQTIKAFEENGIIQQRAVLGSFHITDDFTGNGIIHIIKEFCFRIPHMIFHPIQRGMWVTSVVCPSLPS